MPHRRRSGAISLCWTSFPLDLNTVARLLATTLRELETHVEPEGIQPWTDEVGRPTPSDAFALRGVISDAQDRSMFAVSITRSIGHGNRTITVDAFLPLVGSAVDGARLDIRLPSFNSMPSLYEPATADEIFDTIVDRWRPDLAWFSSDRLAAAVRTPWNVACGWRTYVADAEHATPLGEPFAAGRKITIDRLWPDLTPAHVTAWTVRLQQADTEHPPIERIVNSLPELRTQRPGPTRHLRLVTGDDNQTH